MTMQHQYWVTKKCVLQKFGGKEDDCIVSSDAELDAKLELFRSVADGCLQLQRAIDIYQERICALAQEENTLGRYLKEAGKNEKNKTAGHLLSTAGKALAYTGHQRLTLRTPLVRLHHEVETFRGRAVSDSKVTITEMEKARTEYRAALSWMKAASSQLDPDTGHGLDKFRKAQSQVRASKLRFDRLMLACLQKVDLLAAARCNMFSHALVIYQNSISSFSTKAGDTLSIAASCLQTDQPFEISTVNDLVDSKQDQDQRTFFKADYTDKNTENKSTDDTTDTKSDLLIDGIEQSTSTVDNDLSSLLNINWNITSDAQLPTDAQQLADDPLGDFLPSHLLQSEFQINNQPPTVAEVDKNEMKSAGPAEKTSNNVSWLSLFADLDPLANNNGSV